MKIIKMFDLLSAKYKHQGYWSLFCTKGVQVMRGEGDTFEKLAKTYGVLDSVKFTIDVLNCSGEKEYKNFIVKTLGDRTVK